MTWRTRLGEQPEALTEAPEGVEVGPHPTRLQEAAVLAIGTVAVLVIGVFPLLLGGLAEEHRLSAAGIGQAATLELLTLGLAAGAAGAWFKTERLKLIGIAAGVVLAGVDFSMFAASGATVMLLRAIAGAAEGVLLWITIGMIARQALPERMAGIFFAVQTAGQFLLAVLMAAAPHLGADGGYAILGLTGLAAAALTVLIPARYAPLPRSEGGSGMPPLRGWIALIATVIWVAGGMAVGVYVEPLAHQAHLSDAVAGFAVSSSLAFQIVGSSTATLIAGRLRWLAMFFICAGGEALSWLALGIEPGTALFVAAVSGTGFFGLMALPFLVPMTIETDASRRTAMLSGGAQLVGSALGPFMISFVVSDTEARACLVYAAACTAVALGVMGWLHAAGRRHAGVMPAVAPNPPRPP